MATSREKLEAQALKLPPRERAELVRRLIESLEADAEGDVETEWIQEAERRYADYRKGLARGRSAERVLREAKARLE